MSIHVVVTAVIYHALNGSIGSSAAAKGLWLKFYLSVKGAGAWPKAALLRLRGWLLGPIHLEQKDSGTRGGATGRDVSGYRDPSRHLRQASHRVLGRPASGTELVAYPQIKLVSLPGGVGWGTWGTHFGK